MCPGDLFPRKLQPFHCQRGLRNVHTGGIAVGPAEARNDAFLHGIVVHRKENQWDAAAGELQRTHRLLRTHCEDQRAIRIDEFARELWKPVGHTVC